MMSCGWKVTVGLHDVALAMRHRLQWVIHLQAHSLMKRDEHPAYTPHGLWHTLPLPSKTMAFST